MSDNFNGHEGSTRRECVKYGGTAVATGLLAGCSGSGSTQSGSGGDNNSSTDTGSSGDESYSVTMSPVGTVEFDSAPEEAVVYSHHDVDILVSLGQSDGINSLGFPENYSAVYYDELPGVSLDTSKLTKLYNDGVDKEVFYELDSEVHHIDPVWFGGWSSFDAADIEEIESSIGPFFVKNERLYAGGDAFQGPISNSFQIELTAKQLYPELFGEPPEPGNTSELGGMFDPQRVADIVTGESEA